MGNKAKGRNKEFQVSSGEQRPNRKNKEFRCHLVNKDCKVTKVIKEIREVGDKVQSVSRVFKELRVHGNKDMLRQR